MVGSDEMLLSFNQRKGGKCFRTTNTSKDQPYDNRYAKQKNTRRLQRGARIDYEDGVTGQSYDRVRCNGDRFVLLALSLASGTPVVRPSVHDRRIYSKTVSV